MPTTSPRSKKRSRKWRAYSPSPVSRNVTMRGRKKRTKVQMNLDMLLQDVMSPKRSSPKRSSPKRKRRSSPKRRRSTPRTR